jgi:hypothetical protein
MRSILLTTVAVLAIALAAAGFLTADGEKSPPKVLGNPNEKGEKGETLEDLKATQLALLQTVNDLRKEMASLKKTVGDQGATITANQNAAASNLATLKTWVVDQNYRVEWRHFGGKPPTGGDGATFVADFGKPVLEATALVCHTNLSYGRDDHHVRNIFVAANVEKFEGSKVIVRYRAHIEDDSRNHMNNGGVEVLVFARVK